MLPRNALVLDVGCGDGLIGRLILDRRPDISIRGIELFLRPKTHIPVSRFDGKVIPYCEKAFDVVMFVDVLHHTQDPRLLLNEAQRGARKHILIKGHNRDGFAAGPMLRLMDWVGNAPHNVELTYNYWTERRWRSAFSQPQLSVREYRRYLGLYPIPARWLFERRLHFVCALDVKR